MEAKNNQKNIVFSFFTVQNVMGNGTKTNKEDISCINWITGSRMCDIWKCVLPQKMEANIMIDQKWSDWFLMHWIWVIRFIINCYGPPFFVRRTTQCHNSLSKTFYLSPESEQRTKYPVHSRLIVQFLNMGTGSFMVL